METATPGLVGASELEKEAIRNSGEASSSRRSASTPPDNDAKEPVPRTIHGWKWTVAMTTILSTTFLFALDNTIVADIQPSIINQFNDVERLPWFGVGFGLGSTAVLPWGKAYGIYSVKWLFISTVMLFEVGSAICGGAPNVNALIIGRVLAGIGGSGMYSGCLTYISVTTSNIERPLYMAGVAVAWGAGTVLGPIVGGAFADSSATWRWVRRGPPSASPVAHANRRSISISFAALCSLQLTF
jgi:MFS family permease